MPAKSVGKLARPTLAHVAREAGVSMMTVSRAIRGTPNVDHATRDRIMEIAAKLGYRPDFAARSTATGRFNAIALLLSTADGLSTLPARLLRGIQDELVSRTINLIVSMLPDQSLIEEWGAPTALTHRMCDGLLINYTHQIPRTLIETIHRHQMPAIWINTDQPVNAVRPDDVQAGRIGTEYLIERGHRRIAYVDLSGTAIPVEKRHYSHHDRLEGYLQAMRSAGLPPILTERDASFGAEERVGSILRLLRSPSPPTAYLAYGADFYIGMAAASEGQRAGTDFSVVIFASESPNIYGKHTTTVLTPDADMGALAIRLLLERIQHPSVDLPSRLLPCRIEPGGTVRAIA